MRSRWPGSPPRAARPEVPPALDDIVRRALAPAAGDRYRSGQEMADALEPVVAAAEWADPAVAASMAAAGEADRTRTGRDGIAAADRRAGPGDGRQTGTRPGVASPRRDGMRRRGPRRLDRSVRPPAAVLLAVIAAVGVVGGALLVAFVPGRATGEPPTDPRGVAEVSTAPTVAPAAASPTVDATPTPTLAATEAPATEAAPTAVPAGDVADLCEIFFDIPCGLGPGRYAPSRFETPFDIELGEGWSAADHERHLVTLVRAEGAMVVAGTVREVYPEGRAREPRPRARDIVEAFLATDGVGATRPADVRIDGRRGRSTDLTPLDDDEAVTLFATEGATYRLEPGRTTRVVVLDVRDAIVVLVIEPADGGRLRDLLDAADPAAGTIRWR